MVGPLRTGAALVDGAAVAGGDGGAAGGGVTVVVVWESVELVGELLDELMAVLDCGRCNERHSSPTTISSNSAAMEAPISPLAEARRGAPGLAPTVSERAGAT
jgi:hypothetical protein